MAHIQANGMQLAYEIFPGRAPQRSVPLILVRGLGSQMVQWPQAFIDSFRHAGMDVVIFDNRDIGQSEKLDAAGVPDLSALAAGLRAGSSFPVPYGLDDMADDVVGLMDGLGIEKANLFGMSLGGMVAQHLAFSHRTRFEHIVCVMSASGNRDMPIPRATDVAPPDVEDIEAVTAHLVGNYKENMSPAYPTPEAEMRRVAALCAPRYYPAGIVRQIAATMSDGSRVERLKQVDMPFLVVHGLEDALIPHICGEEIAALVPNAEYLPVPGMGHDIGRGIEAVLQPEICRFFGLPNS